MKRRSRGVPLTGGASLALILGLSFIARELIADQQSYWLDELLSVDTYGVANSSLAAAIARLIRSSIHPPLYQGVLYGWMKLFGTTELATRTLSNLYMAGAALCLYLAAKRPLGQRRALFATLLFSLAYIPVKFALEARSYAQSVLLSALSSWVLFAWMRRFSEAPTTKNALVSGPALALMAANFLLLMTHYYNVFFLAAQGAFVVGWTVRWSKGSFGARLAQLTRAAAPLILPLVAQLAIWGPVMAKSYQKRAESYLADEALEGPFLAFWRYAASRSLREASLVVCVALGVLALVFIAKQVVLARRSRALQPVGRSTFVAYCVATSFGAFLIAWALFTASGHARYVDRYFAFTAPAIAVFFTGALEQLVAPLGHRIGLARHYLRWSALYALLSLGLFLPSTYVAVDKPKKDWRGIAKQVIALADADPGHKYAVYSTGFGPIPSLNYYFKRYESELRVADYLSKQSREGSSLRTLRNERKKIEKHDFLVVTFTHLPPSMFPKTLKELGQRYQLHANLLQGEQGIMIYRVKRED